MKCYERRSKRAASKHLNANLGATTQDPEGGSTSDRKDLEFDGIVTEPTATFLDEQSIAFECLPGAYGSEIESEKVPASGDRAVLDDKAYKKVQDLTEERERLVLETRKMREESRKSTGVNDLSQESFKRDNDKVHFYTGLPNYTILMAVFWPAEAPHFLTTIAIAFLYFIVFF